MRPRIDSQPAAAKTSARRGRLLSAGLGAALALLAPAIAAAQGSGAGARGVASPAAVAPGVARLEAETSRLRAQLEQLNAEIAALKRDPRGVRNDYRLRERMADAEALARRVTDNEAQLRRHKGPQLPPRGARPLPTAPVVAVPGDGPVELEAKADLLADQARRLTAEADGLARTAGQIRGKQTLRKRAAGFDRDPFAAVEGSKRSLVFGSPRPATAGGPNGVRGGGGENSPPPPQGPIVGLPPAPGDRAAGSPTAPPPTGMPPTTGTPGAAPTPGPGTFTPPGGSASPTSAVSVQARTLLDPATLADIQRLEKSGKPLSDAEALDRAATVLKQRAAALDAQAKALRTRARP